jgi:hypothetical protein
MNITSRPKCLQLEDARGIEGRIGHKSRAATVVLGQESEVAQPVGTAGKRQLALSDAFVSGGAK